VIDARGYSNGFGSVYLLYKHNSWRVAAVAFVAQWTERLANTLAFLLALTFT
jgi:hypothetical protein